MSKKVKLYKSVNVLLLEKYGFREETTDGYWNLIEKLINEHLDTNEDFDLLIQKHLEKTKEFSKKEVELEKKYFEDLNETEEVLQEVETENKKERKNKRK